jgi:hypothetical protein
LVDNRDFYLMPKPIWDFFYNIYGGGPAIMKNYAGIEDYSTSRGNY